jgi:hypothetical protein
MFTSNFSLNCYYDDDDDDDDDDDEMTLRAIS